jgi:hypothetical protein
LARTRHVSGFASGARWIRHARAHLRHLLPYVPFRQFGGGSLFISQQAASGALTEIRQAEAGRGRPTSLAP